MNGKTRQALVIGATGGIGGAIAERLAADGWTIRALHRDPARAAGQNPGFDWVKGDAMVEADVVAAAAGCQVIVHGANPPRYHNWAGLQMPMIRATIAAAQASGARILFPGTVYNYGPETFPRLTEDAPQAPLTRKGAIRVQMEQALRDSGCPVLIVRAGDYIGPRPVPNKWLSEGMVKPNRPIASMTYPGPLEVRHAWAYVPDVAEAFVRLLDTDLERFETFHFQGYAVTGHEMAAAMSAAAGRKVTVSQLPWLALALVAPFVEALREMQEMRYLWQRPVLLDNSRLTARLGAEPHTPLDQALRAALAGQGSLPGPARAAA